MSENHGFTSRPYGWGVVFDDRFGSIHERQEEAVEYALDYGGEFPHRVFPLYERRWLPVAEFGYPLAGEFVACLTLGGEKIAARHDEQGWWTANCVHLPYDHKTITHWTPLPDRQSGQD